MTKKILLFSGGRGNKNLLNASIESIKKSELNLNIIVNGLDDGASTGRIRYLFKEETHGISDFLKVVVSLSQEAQLVDAFNRRFPFYKSIEDERKIHKNIKEFISGKASLNIIENIPLEDEVIKILRSGIQIFIEYFESDSIKPSLSDFKIGNIIFASEIIKSGFNFSQAIDSFSKILQVDRLGVKIIESCETPAYLCGILKQGIFLPNEASVVLSRTSDFIEDIYQLKTSLTGEEIREICSLEKDQKKEYLTSIETSLFASNKALNAIKESDGIVFGAGTPFSSLLPSLSLEGMYDSIASKNCPKILVANLKKETNNFYSVNQLIKDIIKFTARSTKNSVDPKLIINHLIVAKDIFKNLDENHISYELDKILEEFPWIKVIETNIIDSKNIFHHDGQKLKNTILQIINES